MRRHGFSLPLEPLQVSTWILLAILVAEFYAIIIEGLKFDPSIICGVIYGLLLVGVIYNGYKACKIDPGDRLTEEELENMCSDSNVKERSFCFLCQILVHKGSRHCRYCDKCIYRFDHHCRWLNNCIGGKNYVNFISLLFLTLALTLLQFALSALLVLSYHFGEEGDILGVIRRDVHFSNWTRKQYAIVIYAFGWVLLPFVGLLIQLIGFHMMLAYRGMTTFDYIIKGQKLERESKEQNALKDLINTQGKLSAVHQDSSFELSHNCRSSSSASSRLKNRSTSFMSDKLKYKANTQHQDSSSLESIDLNIDSPETDLKTHSNAPCSFDSNVPKEDLGFSSASGNDIEMGPTSFDEKP